MPNGNGDIEGANGFSEKESSHAEHKNQTGLPTALHTDRDFVPPTPQEEASVIRKLDWRLTPILFILYMLSVLDRSNLGNAKLAGLEDCTSISVSYDASTRICFYR